MAKLQINTRKLSLIGGGILLLALAGLIFYFFIFQNVPSLTKTDVLKSLKLEEYANCEIPPQYNSFFENESTYPGFQDSRGEEIWEMSTILPYVLGYKELDGRYYMIAGVKNSDNGCTPIAILLGGEFPDVKINIEKEQLEKIYYNDEHLTYQEFQKRVPVGSKVRGYYLSRSTLTTFDEAFCESKSAVAMHCTYSKICQQYGCTTQQHFDYIKHNTDTLLWTVFWEDIIWEN
jgi:hypothetical protein